jgi:hypothetical protein
VIPFLDLVTPHRELEEELVKVFRAALHTAGFIGGPEGAGLEAEFAQFCGNQHCIRYSLSPARGTQLQQ